MKPRTLDQILQKRYKIIQLKGIYQEMFGTIEQNGMWLIWGAEKMGKSTFSLLLANAFAEQKKSLYVMAEQGFDFDFQQLLKRIKIGDKQRLKFLEYMPLTELSESLEKPRSADVIFIDNVTIYADELKREQINELTRKHRNKMFVFIAHEQDNQPYTAAAKLIRKLAKRIVKIEGNMALIDGRGPGGHLMINTQKGTLYHGTEEINQNKES